MSAGLVTISDSNQCIVISGAYYLIIRGLIGQNGIDVRIGQIKMSKKELDGVYGKGFYRTNINSVGERLHSCEVCWSCGYFLYENMGCKLELDIDGCGRKLNPAWFRCVDWYERDD